MFLTMLQNQVNLLLKILLKKTTGTKKNVGGFIGILDTALDCWDIFKNNL